MSLVNLRRPWPRAHLSVELILGRSDRKDQRAVPCEVRHHLNEIEGLEIPTTEVLVGWIALKIAPAFTLPVTPPASSTWCKVLVEDLWHLGLAPRPFMAWPGLGLTP